MLSYLCVLWPYKKSAPRKTYSVRYSHMAGLKGHGHRDKPSRVHGGMYVLVQKMPTHVCAFSHVPRRLG